MSKKCEWGNFTLSYVHKYNLITEKCLNKQMLLILFIGIVQLVSDIAYEYYSLHLEFSRSLI